MDAPGPDRDHQQPRAPSSRSDVPCSMDFRGLFNFSFEAEAEIFRWPFYKFQISVYFEESPMDHASYCLRIGILLKFRSSSHKAQTRKGAC
jgi:hypothetical protein